VAEPQVRYRSITEASVTVPPGASVARMRQAQEALMGAATSGGRERREVDIAWSTTEDGGVRFCVHTSATPESDTPPVVHRPGMRSASDAVAEGSYRP
jgi:hypothetical protein